MSVLTRANESVISPEQIAQRIAEYRHLGWQRRAPAHVVYAAEQHECPWAGCGLRLAGIQFRLEVQGDAAHQSGWLDAWWNGPGLVGRCPHCGRYILFTLDGKRAVSDPSAWGAAVLPDNWHEQAYLVTRADHHTSSGKDALPCRT